MKVTKAQSEKNRIALIRAAGRLFREHGVDGVGVAEIGKEAGLTHGALYAQFGSKDALVSEAFADSMARRAVVANRAVAEKGLDLAAHLGAFLSERHRDNRATGCAITASASELARQDRAVSEAFVVAFDTIVETLARVLADSRGAASARERSIAIAAGEIGGVVLARAALKADPALSSEILAACRSVFGTLAASDERVVAPSAKEKPAASASRPRRKVAKPARNPNR